jgi:hypothetical protein
MITKILGIYWILGISFILSEFSKESVRYMLRNWKNKETLQMWIPFIALWLSWTYPYYFIMSRIKAKKTNA